MKRHDWARLDASERRGVLTRPSRRRNTEVRETVRRIFDEVEAEGEAAVRRWAERLDGYAPERLMLDGETVARARHALASQDLEALEFAAANIRRYHESDRPQDGAAGAQCRRVWRPLESVGLYIPGGTAPLFSTLLMLAIPASCAGTRKRVAVTPPARQGGAHPMMIAAAAACALDSLWLLGGPQAIAAMTFGAGLPRVDKIFGPGNAYVSEAKRYAAELPGGSAIDLPAGPSELLVIADETVDAALVAADLLSQAEHDADAQVLLVTTSVQFADAAAAQVERQLASLPRAAIARAALENASIVLVRDVAEAVEVSNLYAPEHLSLQIADPEALLPRVERAGAVFVGPWAAGAFGDYVSGPSHVLPTDGAARIWAGVSVSSFMTSFVVQNIGRDDAARMAGPAAHLARIEGLEAHARAADARARLRPE
ncbi:MAG: histidinol dehydrogenase [Rhizomicrobium sp.]